MERKSFATEVATADEQGVLEAIVSVFGNTDTGNDIVVAGAFEKSLAKRTPKGVWAHDWTTPVAKTLEARELKAGDVRLPMGLRENGGLYIKGHFNLETQAGREAYSNIKFGIIDEFSIGFRSVKEDFDKETKVRQLQEVELFEWSPVLVGMNPETSIISIKSDVLATLANQADDVLAYIEKLASRTKSLVDLRAKEGRVISTANRSRISACVTSMRSVADELDALLSMSDPMPKADAAEVRRLYAEILTSGYLTENVKKWN